MLVRLLLVLSYRSYRRRYGKVKELVVLSQIETAFGLETVEGQYKFPIKIHRL